MSEPISRYSVTTSIGRAARSGRAGFTAEAVQLRIAQQPLRADHEGRRGRLSGEPQAEDQHALESARSPARRGAAARRSRTSSPSRSAPDGRSRCSSRRASRARRPRTGPARATTTRAARTATRRWRARGASRSRTSRPARSPIAETTANAAKKNRSATRARTALIRGGVPAQDEPHGRGGARQDGQQHERAGVGAGDRHRGSTGARTPVTIAPIVRRAVLRLAGEAGHEVGQSHRQQPDPDGDHATASRSSPCARRIAYRPPRSARCETAETLTPTRFAIEVSGSSTSNPSSDVGVPRVHRRHELVTALQERVHGSDQRRRLGPLVDPAGPQPARPLSPLLQFTNHVDRLPRRPPRRTVLFERSPRRLVAQQLAGADPEPDIDLAEEGEPHDQRGIERRHEVHVQALELVADRRRERLRRPGPGAFATSNAPPIAASRRSRSG